MTKDGSTILKALEILKTREAGYTELVDRIFADMDALQKAKSVKPTSEPITLVTVIVVVILYDLLETL